MADAKQISAVSAAVFAAAVVGGAVGSQLPTKPTPAVDRGILWRPTRRLEWGNAVTAIFLRSPAR